MCAASLSLPAYAGGATGGGIGVRLVPETGKQDAASPFITNAIAPGETVTRTIRVTNSTGQTIHIDLYAAGASMVENTFTFADGRTASAASSYTTVSPAGMALASGASRMTKVTIAVPRDAAPGNQYGVVWAEARAAAASDTGIVQVSRVGIREYLHIGPGGLTPAAFTLTGLRADRSADGHRMVRATVHNTGGHVLDLTGSLTLSGGPAGTSTGPFSAALASTLAPGASTAVVVMMPVALQKGPWKAALTVKDSSLSHTESATLTFPDGTAWWWWLIATISILILGILLWWRRSRRQRDESEAVPAQET